MWEVITTAIDAGRPVAGANNSHGFVVIGYEMVGSHAIHALPRPGERQVQEERHHHDDGRPSPDQHVRMMPASVNARKQEPGVTKDSDGDKVVDFDETERFRTDPGKKDSDADKVPDKRDIASGVFDPTFGYADHRTTQGRDFDGDRVPTESDPDSDGGGCTDGDEDEDLDGHWGDKETWNFDDKDDVCGDLSGTITLGPRRDPRRSG